LLQLPAVHASDLDLAIDRIVDAADLVLCLIEATVKE
jgi:hypothetical protein